ncbi:MAG TPA: hypothetical protein VMB26_14515 [Candidatus Binataceae bacterium]|nr:hypothetical protein [Candidatus Binataceae bacterium]
MKFLTPIVGIIALLLVAASPVPILTIQAGANGNGGIISGDGKTVLYSVVNRIRKVDVASGTEQALPPPPGICDSSPVTIDSISPDGKKLLITCYGGTGYWPSDIFIMNGGGSDAKKLTPESAVVGPGWKKYHYDTAQFSPDGTKISLRRWCADECNDETFTVMVMNSDGSNLHRVAAGAPMGWDASGKGFYVNDEGNYSLPVGSVSYYDLAAKTDKPFKADGVEGERVLGMIGNGFAVDKEVGWVTLYPIVDSKVIGGGTLPIPTKLEQQSKWRDLARISSDKSGSILLLQYGDDEEPQVLQVIKVK